VPNLTPAPGGLVSDPALLMRPLASS